MMNVIRNITLITSGVVYIQSLIIFDTYSINVLFVCGFLLLLSLFLLSLDWRYMASINIPAVVTASSFLGEDNFFNSYYISMLLFFTATMLLMLFPRKKVARSFRLIFAAIPTIIVLFSIFNAAFRIAGQFYLPGTTYY